MSEELLASVVTAVRDVVVRTGRPLRRIRVATGGTSVELIWAPTRHLPGGDTRIPAGDTTIPERNATVVTAAVAGTFYAAAEPGAAPFVRAGDAVGAQTQIGIIEAMKLMTPVTAGTSGVIDEVLVADAEPVEYRQPLLRLRTAHK